MYQKEVNIVNPTGIHARPASQIVAKAGTYSSKITIRRADDTDDTECNAKSIIMLLALGLSQGERAILTAKGEDAEKAVKDLAEFIEGLKE